MKTNEALVLDMFRAVEERDLERVLEIYHPDVEFVWPPGLPGYRGTYRGRDVLAMNDAFAAVWDPVQQTAEARRLHSRIVASNDAEVVALYRQGGNTADGERYETEVLGLYRFEDGRVIRLQMFYFDPDRVSELLSAATQ